MHYISSNFNMLETNSDWNEIKKSNFCLDKNFKGALISLNSKKVINSYKTFHILFYFDSNNLENTFKELKYLLNLSMKNNKKLFFYYFFDNFYDNIFLKKKYNNHLYNLKINYENVFFKIFDIKKNLLSERNNIFIKFPFEVKFIKFISREIKKKLFFIQSKPYKLIILDCDNTLWGGILNEDGVENIKYRDDFTGQIFYQFQLFLKKKKKEGFLLSICSKNNEQDVWNVMKKRGMELQKKDFISPKINWGNKAENINQIIQQITIRPEDCIFIDDNPFEIESVKSKIKNLNFLEISDYLTINEKIKKNPRFFKFKILKEDLQKYYQYHLKSKFDNVAKKSNNSLDFYKKLNQKIKFINVSSNNIDRCLQLFNKTNQFNFSLNRYNNSDLKKIIQSKSQSIFLVSFEDRFGDHGVIGAYVLSRFNNQVIVKDFVLSCRVLNRYVEDFIIINIFEKYPSYKIKILYSKTNLNNALIPVFLKKAFFKLSKKCINKYEYNINFHNDFKQIKKIFGK